MPDETHTPNPEEPIADASADASADATSDATPSEAAPESAQPSARAAEESGVANTNEAQPEADAAAAAPQALAEGAAQSSDGGDATQADAALGALDNVEAGVASLVGGNEASADAAQPFVVPPMAPTDPSLQLGSIELLDDVELDVKIELGRTEMVIEDVLQLGVGSVVELDKLAGDPVDIFVNERLVARGEVLVLNDNFCVRVNEILSPIPELEVAT